MEKKSRHSGNEVDAKSRVGTKIWEAITQNLINIYICKSIINVNNSTNSPRLPKRKQSPLTQSTTKTTAL